MQAWAIVKWYQWQARVWPREEDGMEEGIARVVGVYPA